MLAMTPSFPKRSMSCALMVSMCSIRGRASFVLFISAAFWYASSASRDCLVSDRVRENLQAAAVQSGHGALVLLGIPEELTALRWIVRVGSQHGGGMRFNHAIEHGFYDTA